MDACLAGLEGSTITGAGEVAVTVAGEGITELASQAAPQAMADTVAPSVAQTVTPQAGSAFSDAAMSGASQMGIAEGAGSTVSTPWYQTILNAIKSLPPVTKETLPAYALAGQAGAGFLGSMGAAGAKEKELEQLRQMPAIQQQAQEQARAGAGQSRHVAPAENLMPPEWMNAGVVPRDPVTGQPLGIVYPRAGLINSASRGR